MASSAEEPAGEHDSPGAPAAAAGSGEAAVEAPEKFVVELKWYVWNVIWQAANSLYAESSEGPVHAERLRMAGEDQQKVDKHARRLAELAVVPPEAVERLRLLSAAAGKAAAAAAVVGKEAEGASLAMEAEAWEGGLAGASWPGLAGAVRLAALSVASHLLLEHCKAEDPSFADPSHWYAGNARQKEFEAAWEQLYRPRQAAAEAAAAKAAAPEAAADDLEAEDEDKEVEEVRALSEGVGTELKWYVWNCAWHAANTAYAEASEGEVKEKKERSAAENLQRTEEHLKKAVAGRALRVHTVRCLGEQASAAGRLAAAAALRGEPLAEGARSGAGVEAPPAQLLPLWKGALAAVSLAAEAVAEMLLDEYGTPGAVEAGTYEHYANGQALLKDFEQAWHQLYDTPPPLPVPGMPPPWPITGAWLAAKAKLPKGPPLTTRESGLPKELDEGMASICSMLRLRLSGEGAEEWYVVKRAHQEHADVGALWREYSFYTELASAEPLLLLDKFLHVPKPLVACWGPEKGQEARNFLLVLERLQPPAWSRVDPVDGCSVQQAVSAVRALGQFHAKLGMAWIPHWAMNGPVIGPEPLDSIYGACFGRCAARLRKLLSPVGFGICFKLVQGGLQKLVNMLRKPPHTLLHGDYRTENIRFAPGASGPVAVFDWGLVSRGRGSWDFAHFLALSLRPELRRGHQQEIVRKYLQQFPGDRTSASSVDLFKDEVRAGFLCLIAKLLFVFVDFQGKPQTLEMLERSLQWTTSAAEDWAALTVLLKSEALGRSAQWPDPLRQRPVEGHVGRKGGWGS